MSAKVKVRVTVSNGLVGCKRSQVVEVDRADWEDMNEREREEMMLEQLWGMIDWDFAEVEA